jgi:hypothetical protein
LGLPWPQSICRFGTFSGRKVQKRP